MALHSVREKGSLRIEMHTDGNIVLARLGIEGRIINAVTLHERDRRFVAHVLLACADLVVLNRL
ncbi:MAG TPA: hypothetical protein VKA31_11425 [Mariprofundaceae bacterium]|nr:hypothetical protein [Mariprofundaceae bacterium]